MRAIIILIFFLTTSIGFSQDESCAFSDGNYHYQVQIVRDGTLPTDFNKNDFIAFLEANSDISASDSTLLNNHIIDLFKQYPNEQVNPFQNMVYIISDVDSLRSIFNMFSDILGFSSLSCDCTNAEGDYFTYARLLIEDVPGNDFDKMDFIQHLQLNSNISPDDTDLLNASIIEVYRSFPSSQNENLQKTVSIISNFDLLSLFLYDFPASIDLTELICDNTVLTIAENELAGVIQIIPNPVTETTNVYLNNSGFENLSIIDITGRNIVSKNIQNLNSIQLSQFNLKNGVYFLKFTKSNTTVTKKIVVN